MDGDVLYAKIIGVMKLADQQALQKAALGLMARGSKLRLHVALEDFQGWEKGEEWGDVEFLMTHGDDIARIAIVGDPRWMDQTLAFAGKGFRATEIEFFPPSSAKEADLWIHE
jgi:hypothetical protein